MSEADQARTAKYLGEVSHYMKELVKILETLNKNFVSMVEYIKNADITIETTNVDELVEEDKQRVADFIDRRMREVLGQEYRIEHPTGVLVTEENDMPDEPNQQIGDDSQDTPFSVTIDVSGVDPEKVHEEGENESTK